MLPDLKTPLLWLLASAAVVAGGWGVQRHVALQAERAAHQKTIASHAAQEATRERVAREDAQEVSRLQARHAANQQELIHAFYARREKLAAADALRLAADRSVWNLANHYAASRGREAEGDSVSCRAAKAGLRSLTDLLAEGHELAGEGVSLLLQRDAELELWIGVGGNDRALTGQGTYTDPSTARP